MNVEKVSPTKPTRVRYTILFMLCMLAMITYMDRAMYGSAKNDVMAALGQPITDFYLVLIFFQLAYATFEIPTGWMGDKYGPRMTLFRIVAWWSLFVALTGAAGMALPGTNFVVIGFGVFLVMQFCFGMGEAGAFPNIARSLYNWFPATQRGFAQGAVWLSARFMGGLTPAMWVLLTLYCNMTWRQNLWLFAGVALSWCTLFYFWFRNRPDEHSSVNAVERDLIDSGKDLASSHNDIPWRAIFTNRNVWALCAMYVVTNFNWYFLLYNLPGMLKDQFPELGKTRQDTLLLALVGGSPLLVGMFGCLFGGLLTDWYIRRTGNRKWGRRLFAMLGYGLAGIAYLLAAITLPLTQEGASFWIFAPCAIAVGFFNDLIMSPSWATAQDIGRRYSAIVSGTMNMIGNLGAVMGLLVSGQILKAYSVVHINENGTILKTEVLTKGYEICFLLYATIYAVGVGLWLLIDPTKPIVIDDHTTEGTASSKTIESNTSS
jgi:ACS family glucarate transporter-like MFS transporter